MVYNYGRITLRQTRQFMPLGYPHWRSTLSSDRWRNPLDGMLLQGRDEPLAGMCNRRQFLVPPANG